MFPPSPHNFFLFEIDFNVKFPMLRLLLFLSDLKSFFFSNKNCIVIKFDEIQINVIFHVRNLNDDVHTLKQCWGAGTFFHCSRLRLPLKKGLAPGSRF